MHVGSSASKQENLLRIMSIFEKPVKLIGYSEFLYELPQACETPTIVQSHVFHPTCKRLAPEQG